MKFKKITLLFFSLVIMFTSLAESVKAPNGYEGFYGSTGLKIYVGDDDNESAYIDALPADGETNLAEYLVKQIINGRFATSAKAFFLNGRAKITEFSGKIITITLYTNAESNDDVTAEFISILYNSLKENFNITGLNLLVNGRPCSLYGVGLGTVNGSNKTSETIKDRQLFKYSQNGSIDITVYYPMSGGKYMYPVLVKEINNNCDSIIEALAKENENPLLKYSLQEDGLMPEKNACRIITDDGERILEIYFPENTAKKVDALNIERWQFLASLCLTATTNICDIDGIRVKFGESYTVTSVPYNGSSKAFENGIIRRADFENDIYYLNSDASAAGDECLIYDALIEKLDTMGYPDSVLGLRVTDRTAYLNLSADFYCGLQSLSYPEEKETAYSIVNYLCGFKGIDAVRFYFSGATADYFAQSIATDGFLLPVP